MLHTPTLELEKISVDFQENASWYSVHFFTHSYQYAEDIDTRFLNSGKNI